MAEFERQRHQQATPMGERILAFMSANYITDLAEFAEGVVGVPRATLESWIFDALDPEALPVKPILLCAEALGTNAEYLTGMSDDPRPWTTLTYDENVLLQSFRDIKDPRVRDRVLRRAATRAAESRPRPHQNLPFPQLPPRLEPPANEE